jgi:hypothetical protein
MFLSRFVSILSFNIFWGFIGALIAFAWVRFLLEPKRSAASVGMSRTRALRMLILFSLGWYIVWGTVHGLVDLLISPPR